MTSKTAYFPGMSGARRIGTAVWAGRLLSVIAGGMILLSAAMKLVQAPQIVDEMVGRLGYTHALLAVLAALEITSVALYAIPRTSVLGAVLLTGYLGGAVASHLRIGDPFLVPLMLGVFAWGGLYLRDARLRELLPLRS